MPFTRYSFSICCFFCQSLHIASVYLVCSGNHTHFTHSTTSLFPEDQYDSVMAFNDSPFHFTHGWFQQYVQKIAFVHDIDGHYVCLFFFKHPVGWLMMTRLNGTEHRQKTILFYKKEYVQGVKRQSISRCTEGVTTTLFSGLLRVSIEIERPGTSNTHTGTRGTQR